MANPAATSGQEARTRCCLTEDLVDPTGDRAMVTATDAHLKVKLANREPSEANKKPRLHREAEAMLNNGFGMSD